MRSEDDSEVISAVFSLRFCAKSLQKIDVEYEFYHINRAFEPVFTKEIGANEWLYIVNFYGQLSNEYLQTWKQRYDRVIVDNAQSYFQMPVDGLDTLYTCRKYFGVADVYGCKAGS